MSDVRAADLPTGSVVADGEQAYIKTHPTRWSQWRATSGAHIDDTQVQDVLDTGGAVLRVGTGEARR